MKKLFTYLLCLVLTITTLCSCGTKNAESASGKITKIPPYGSRNIAAFGDSIASGYGLDNQSDNYISIFAKNIGATLENEAVSGNESSDLLALLQSGKVNNSIRNADIIVISIGGNDLLHQKDLFVKALKDAYFNKGEFFTEEINKIYAQLEGNLRECISIIHSNNPTAAIIVQTVYNPFIKQELKVSIVNVGKLANRYINKLNETIKSACYGNENVCVFDIAERMNEDKENFYNVEEQIDIHPTVKGHTTLAQIYTDDFNSLVK